MNATLLLIPGLLNTPRVFDRMRRFWTAPADILVADVQTQASIAAMAADAWAQLAGLPPERPLVVAGFSMGGYVALQMLATAARPVQGLGLVCTSARPDAPEGASQRERAIAAIGRDFSRYVTGLTGFLLSPASQADAELSAEVRADMLAVGGATAVHQHLAAAGRADQRALLRGLTLPVPVQVQVVAGTADPVTPLALSEEMLALLPNTPAVRLDTIDGAGHLLPFEHPQRLAALLGGLVERAARAAQALPTTPGDRLT